MEPLFRVWARNLRTHRHAAGITQQHLADACGVDQSTVCRWEHPGGGYRPPRDRHKIAVATALGVDLAELFPLELAEQVGR